MGNDFFSTAMRRILVQVPRPTKIISALSGGLDSVTLLHLLAQWRKNLPSGTQLIAAHLNHNLRGSNAVLDHEFSRDLAKSLDIDFAEQSVDAAAIARVEGMGVEEAGRMLRYRFFHDLGGSESLVLTGHHADDQAETILLHLRRGAHRRALSGMRELSHLPIPPGMKVLIGRPLLRTPREKLREIAVQNDWQWREDESNADTSYSRNRIRHRIIPALENVMPGFRRRLLRKAARMAEEEEELTRRGTQLAEDATRHEHGGRFFRIDEAVTEEPERLLYALRHVVEDELGARLPYGAVLSRISQLAESGRLGETLSLPGRLRVRRESDGLFFFFPDRDGGDSYGEFILPDPPFRIRAYGMDVSALWLPCSGRPPPEDMDDPEVEWFEPQAIRWPLRLRPPRPGERFRPLGAPGSRKIQDILVDLKTPRRQRTLPRLLADHAGGLWLWPLRLAHRARLNGKAGRALRIEIRCSKDEKNSSETAD